MTSQHTPRRSAAARVTAALAIATGVAGTTLLASSNPAGASVRTDSEAVATQAERALDALDTWQASNRPLHYVRFLRARETTADLLAADLGISGDELLDEWTAADEPKQVAMLSALTQLGVPYRSITSKPGVGFDCSGLTIWAFAQAGIELPRVSGDQISAAERIDEADAEPGDLLYYPGHISIYVGEGMMVHSPYTGSTVEVTNVASRTSRWGDSMTVGDD
ncbi:MAG: C40 family peptidase [Ilumatobacteraceae bacterium]